MFLSKGIFCGTAEAIGAKTGRPFILVKVIVFVSAINALYAKGAKGKIVDAVLNDVAHFLGK